MKKIMVAVCLFLLAHSQWIQEETQTTELVVEDQQIDIPHQTAPEISQEDVISPERIKKEDSTPPPQQSSGNPFERGGPKPQKERPSSKDPFGPGNRQPQSEEEMNKMREQRMKEFAQRREGKGGNKKGHKGKPDRRQSESSFSLSRMLNSEWGVLLFVSLGLAVVVKLCCTKQNKKKNLRRVMRQQGQEDNRERAVDQFAEPMQMVSQNEQSVDEEITYHEQQLDNLRRNQEIPVGQPLPYHPMNVQIYRQ